MADVTEIKPEILSQLKEQLNAQYVHFLPPLLEAKKPEDKVIKQTSRALSAFVLSKRFEVTEAEAGKLVIDDCGDNGIDAFYYSESDSKLYLLQSKLTKKQVKLDEVLKFTQGVGLLIEKEFSTFNQNFKALENQFETWLDECREIILILAYTGGGITGTAKTTLNAELSRLQREDERVQGAYEEFTGEDVEKYLTSTFAPQNIKETIQIYNYSKLSDSGKSCLGLMKLSDLVALYDEYGNALYDKNIRFFIGSGKKGVNSAIKKTLVEEPEKFVLLNNGVTAVSETVEPGSKVRDEEARNIRVTGLSVVNGAQTISSAKQYFDNLEEGQTCDAMVTFTLIESGEDEELHKQVTRARNLQNPVELSDFVALDDTQERLRVAIKLQGFEYHYRPQPNLPGAITIDVVAKALACLDDNIAYTAQLKSSSRPFEDIGSDEYQVIFPTDISAVTVINSYHFFIATKELLLNAEKASNSPEKLVYRHSLYPMSYLVLKYFSSKIIGTEILEKADIQTMISSPFDEMRQSLFDSFPSNETSHAFFKRSPDVERLIENTIVRYCGLASEEGYTSQRNYTNRSRLTKYLLDRLKQKGQNA